MIGCCGDQLHKPLAYAWCGHHLTRLHAFLASNFADGKNIQLACYHDRDHSESPGKSMVGDRNDGS